MSIKLALRHLPAGVLGILATACTATPGPELGEAAPPQAAIVRPPTNTWWTRDDDGDCLSNGQELLLGTDPGNPDTDGDGWFDGPCNERRRLVLTSIRAFDEQEDEGVDELYLVVDDVRFPHSDLDDYWAFDDGDTRYFDLPVAQRVRGTNATGYLRSVAIEAWEDDYEARDTWAADDLLFSLSVNLASYSNGQTFAVRRTYSDLDYELRFRVEVERFADPNPLHDGDTDGDGIPESSEFRVSRDFGGIADPTRPEVLVEVDWMSGHTLATAAKRQVATQLFRHGIFLYLHRHQVLPLDSCLTLTQARALYNSYFTFRSYGAFRYAVMTERLWHDGSEAAIGDAFFMDDSTWWINGDPLAQAGTLLHALGHTFGLTREVFPQIDTSGNLSYRSAMSYTYQATLVNYSEGTGGSNDHNDWADVALDYGLQYSFGSSTGSDNGVCQ